jgi:large subunit ribosomal protein L23
MKLEPIITEKSTKLAKEGKYTFKVGVGLRKPQIKKLIEDVFGVHVKRIWTMNMKGEQKRTLQGRKRRVMPSKKAIVTLGEKESLDLFETKGK